MSGIRERRTRQSIASVAARTDFLTMRHLTRIWGSYRACCALMNHPMRDALTRAVHRQSSDSV